MRTDRLEGSFVMGTTKTGAQFLGVVDSVDNEYLYLSYKAAKKIVMISEIAEMKVEEYRESGGDVQ